MSIATGFAFSMIVGGSIEGSEWGHFLVYLGATMFVVLIIVYNYQAKKVDKQYDLIQKKYLDAYNIDITLEPKPVIKEKAKEKEEK